jgi:hypothetical protein
MAEMSLAHQVFLAFCAGGWLLSTSTFAMVRSAYLMFTIPALVPIAVQFFLISITLSAMGAMVCLYGLLLWRSEAQLCRKPYILLPFENRK